MTREEFKNVAMKVLAQQTTRLMGKDWKLFDSDDINYYGIVEYDDDGFSAVNGMPFEEFLDELFNALCVRKD